MIEDDTDLLILLCYHNDLQSPFSVYLKPQPPKKTATSYEYGTSNAVKKNYASTYVEIY